MSTAASFASPTFPDSDSSSMTDTFRPENDQQVLDALQWAAAEEHALEVVGSGTKTGFGRLIEAGARLDVSGLGGIGLYEPQELVLTAKASTPMAEIEAALTEKGQHLAFDPPDLGRLLGGDGRGNVGGTLGGAIGCNLAGPRRLKAGAARDHLLGFSAVSGRGETFKSGGRVVKNVTGFDLAKLISGSFGTLAVMTEVSVKVLPAPEKTRTVLVFGCADADATRAMTAALHSPYEVASAAHLPAAIAGASDVSHVTGAGGAVTAVSVEGPGPSVEFRCRALRGLLAPFGQIEELHSANSAALWREIRDVVYFTATGDQRPVWRLSVPPADGARVAAEILGNVDGQAYYDWGGGLVWLALNESESAGHRTVREAVTRSGGHATLVRAIAETRAQVPVFHPQPAPLAELTRRVKEGFDPNGVLNPGRMYEGV